jgi:hypothetical protein
MSDEDKGSLWFKQMDVLEDTAGPLSEEQIEKMKTDIRLIPEVHTRNARI